MKSGKKTPQSKTSASQSVSAPIMAAATKTGKAAKPVKVAKTAKVASSATGSQALGGNPARLLAHLASLLNSNDFTTFSQTAVSRETGIPLGYHPRHNCSSPMTANGSMPRLCKSGRTASRSLTGCSGTGFWSG